MAFVKLRMKASLNRTFKSHWEVSGITCKGLNLEIGILGFELKHVLLNAGEDMEVALFEGEENE